MSEKPCPVEPVAARAPPARAAQGIPPASRARWAVEAGAVGELGHGEHRGRVGGDAELAALAGLGVDRDRAAAGDGGHVRVGPVTEAGAASRSTASKPAVSARSLISTC